MQLDPYARKRQSSLSQILVMLNDENLSTDLREALNTLWRYVDSQDTHKIMTKKNYVVGTRRIFRRIGLRPKESPPETLIEIMAYHRRKKDGSDYSPQYRNVIRTIIRQILKAFERKDLISACNDTESKIGQIMRVQRMTKPVDQFDTHEQITEEHIKPVNSQMRNDQDYQKAD